MQFRMVREFIRLEASGGIILFSAAVLALVVDNSAWHSYYQKIFAAQVGFNWEFAHLHLVKPFILWVNEGLMTLFFLLVGLEVKRELFEGELKGISKAGLPIFTALGGMIVPALLYVYCNWGHSVALRGWAIPTATDIAFSLGVLALLGSRIPASLKVFLTAFAIFDDVGGIIIIAAFYTAQVVGWLLLVAAVLALVLLLLNRLNVTRLTPYFIVGFLIWLCVLKSGVHATLAGILLAFAIPLRSKKDPEHSPLRSLEHKLHPWVAFMILPIFAFANAGISFHGMHWGQLLAPIPFGIAGGLFIGKQIGVLGATWLAVRLGVARRPHGSTWMGIYGIALVSGIGFTMSLFIGGLAFGHLDQQYINMVRVGVLFGSLISGLLGYIVLRCCHQHPQLLLAKK